MNNEPRPVDLMDGLLLQQLLCDAVVAKINLERNSTHWSYH